MVEYKYADYFPRDRTDRQMMIESDDGLIKITNKELHQQQFELTESLCSEKELTFGSCEASCIKFTVSNTFISMKDKWLTVKLNPADEADEPLQIGRYKVYSDIRSADRTTRDVVAYDAMYDILNADVAEWYNTILPDDNSTITLKKFRESFVEHFGLEEADIALINDDMTIEKTVTIVANSETEDTSTVGEVMSGKDVIISICEINGCFGHIGRDGKFHYIYLPQAIQGLYPAANLYPDHAPDYLPYQQDIGHLYPQNPKGEKVGVTGSYISCTYEDFLCKSVKKLQIRQEEDDIGVIVGSEGNSYVIEDNFLVYGKGSTELSKIANNILGKISNLIYRPAEVDCAGNPCFEVGDPVRLVTKYEIIESYILQRTLKGIQALRDDYVANGVETYSEEVNSVQYSIKQIRGKANILKRTIEETKLEMVDLINGLDTEITVTAEKIETEVTRATNAEGELSSKITQTADSITAEVTRATNAEGELSASIQINADAITSKVSKGSISSEISQEAGAITITANRFSWTSTYSSLSADGTLTSDNGSHWVKITNGTLQAGKHGASMTAYVAGNTYKTSTGIYGLRLAGKGVVAVFTPSFGVGSYADVSADATYMEGQSASQKFITDLSVNENGTISWEWKTISFTKGLMTTVIS